MKWIIFTLHVIGTINIAIGEDDHPLICRKVSPPVEGNSPVISETASDFKSLVINSNLIVDNSLFIRNILEIPRPVIKITCPESWGKSINLMMFASFVAIRFTSSGAIIPMEKTENHKLFVEGELTQKQVGITHKLEHPLAISKHKKIIDKYLAKYPVILVDFSTYKPISHTYEEFYEYFQKLVSRLYGSFNFLSRRMKAKIEGGDEPDLDDTNYLLKRFEAYLSKKETVQAKMADSIAFLCKLLNSHCGQNVIVLIDEYDKVIHSLYSHDGVQDPVVRKIMDFYYSIMTQTFRHNANLKKGVLTGVQNIAMSYEQDGLDLITSSQAVAEPGMLPQFGFAEDQVDQLFVIYEVPEELRRRAKRWYGGYRVSDRVRTAYNPRSVVKFLNRKTLDNYRLLNESMDLFVYVKDLEDVKSTFQSLMDRKSVSFLPKRELSYQDIITLKRSLEGRNVPEPNTRLQVLLTYLHAIGYLTSESPVKKNEEMLVTIPNREVDAMWHELMSESKEQHLKS